MKLVNLNQSHTIMKLRMHKIPVVIFAAAVVASTSCNFDKSTPGFEYMPDMYRGPAIEAYQPDGGALKPVQGSIPRGHDLYAFEDSPEGYDAAQASLKIPAQFHLDGLSEEKKEKVMAESKELYNIFCTHCHGEKGDGQGILVKNEKILGVPSYASAARPDINEGTIYHVIHYGKGIMGSHASQMTQEERWKVTNYVLKLRKDLDGSAAAE